jgi:hypothetical protein
MEYYQQLQNIDDAMDLFLLAKERLLDVNDWQSMAEDNNHSITLTNSKGEKQQRDARVGDMVNIKSDISNIWIDICKIQYDFFPDISSESISFLFKSGCSPSGSSTHNRQEYFETILLKREGATVTIHCNNGNELPGPNANTPDEQIDNNTEMHPVLNIPLAHLQQLLKSMIAVYEYTPT